MLISKGTVPGTRFAGYVDVVVVVVVVTVVLVVALVVVTGGFKR